MQFRSIGEGILWDVFIVIIINREAQNKLCGSTKTPEEVYRIALSYEQVDKYAKTYVSKTRGRTPSSTTGKGSLQIKTQPMGAIRGDEGNIRQRVRTWTVPRKIGNSEGECYKKIEGAIIVQHLKRCPARSAICNFCRKTGHYEKTCRENVATEYGRQWR